MRMIVNLKFPVEPFNTLVRQGTAGSTLASILAEIKPEAIYFYAPDGCRGGTMIVDLADASQIPSIAEPFFLKLGATCEFHVAMTADDLANAGLDALGKKWG